MSTRRLVGSIAAVLSLAGCFATAADYREEAETFIVETVAIPGEDIVFATARCDEPQSQDPGTEFACAATDQDGGTWRFAVTIEEGNRSVGSATDRP